MSLGPSVPSAVAYPNVIAGICENEAQAVVGQIGNPYAAFSKQSVLQKCDGPWTWKTGIMMTFFLMLSVIT